MTVQEAAELWKISVWRMQRLCKEAENIKNKHRERMNGIF